MMIIIHCTELKSVSDMIPSDGGGREGRGGDNCIASEQVALDARRSNFSRRGSVTHARLERLQRAAVRETGYTWER